MSTVYTATVNGITWRYKLSGSAPNQTATIGDGTASGATTAYGDLSGNIVIPADLSGNPVTAIEYDAFKSTKIRVITIPSSVTNIGASAFRTSQIRRAKIIGNSLTLIASDCFRSSYDFNTINLPDSLWSIGTNSFVETSTLQVTLSQNRATHFGYGNLPIYNATFYGRTGTQLLLPPSPPTMTITSTTAGVTSGSTTNNASIALTFTSSQSTTDFVLGDISVTNGTLSGFDGSGNIYNATFTPTIAGVCTINIAANQFTFDDIYSNTASNTFTWTFDNVAPTMIIESTTPGVTSGSTTNNTSIALRFTSSKATTNFVLGDISVTNGTISAFASSSSTVYTAIFSPTVVGLCTIGVAAGVYTDAVGNSNTVASFNLTSTNTAWNIDPGANHLIKSYVKDFVDVSGMVMLRENSNLCISGNAETAGNLLLNRLFVTADASFNRRIFVGGDVSMNGNVNVSGDLSMNGTVTKCNFNNSSIPKSAFSGTVPDGADYTTANIVYDQTFQANDDVSMNGATFASNNVKVSGNIVFGDGTVMNTYDNNVLTTNPTVFKPSTFTALDICGNLVAGSYATSSDYRIKTNVVELDETYTVDKLRPVKYFQTQINREKYGLIAHELQEHYPDLVIGEKDGSELQRVNYTGLIAILINEIKRLKHDLEVLELQQR